MQLADDLLSSSPTSHGTRNAYHWNFTDVQHATDAVLKLKSGLTTLLFRPVPPPLGVVLVPAVDQCLVYASCVRESIQYSYIFFPRSASVPLPSNRSRASSISPMWPLSVPSNSSWQLTSAESTKRVCDNWTGSFPHNGRSPSGSILVAGSIGDRASNYPCSHASLPLEILIQEGAGG